MTNTEFDKELQTEILKDIGEISNLPVSLDLRLKWITEVTARRLEVDSCSICLVDQERQLVVLKASTGFNPSSINRVELRIGEGITGWCALHKEPVILENAFQDERFLYVPSTGEEKYASLYAHPVIFENECIAVFLINSLKIRKFSRTEINIVNTISHFVSGIIQNTILFEKQEQALFSRTLLFNYSQHIVGEKSEQRIHERMLEAINALTQAHHTGFWLRKSRDTFQLMNKAKEDRLFFNHTLHLKKLHNTSIATFTCPRQGKCEEVMSNDISCFVRQRNPLSGDLIPFFLGKRVAGLILIIKESNEGVARRISEQETQRVMTLLNLTSATVQTHHLYQNLLDKNRQLREKESALIESEKNSALGKLATDLAHEIKNPLLSIGGFAKRLDQKLVGNETLKKYTEIIIDEASRLEELVKKTLSFIKGHDLHLRKVDLGRVLMERFHHYRELHKENVRIQAEIDKNLILLGDEGKLIEVFSNLIENSLAFSQKEGTCELHLSAKRGKTDKNILVKVHDNCGGVQPDSLTNLGKPYYTTRKHSSGLGLFIVNKIVSAHGGTVSYRNEGEGLLVTLTFQAV